eukprot:505797-Hanusia_phi.AAC.1
MVETDTPDLMADIGQVSESSDVHMADMEGSESATSCARRRKCARGGEEQEGRQDDGCMRLVGMWEKKLATWIVFTCFFSCFQHVGSALTRSC